MRREVQAELFASKDAVVTAIPKEVGPNEIGTPGFRTGLAVSRADRIGPLCHPREVETKDAHGCACNKQVSRAIGSDLVQDRIGRSA